MINVPDRYAPYKKIAKDVGIIGITKVLVSIGSLSGIILVPILTKNLALADYGIFVQLVYVLALLMPVATLGLPFTAVRYIAGEKNKKEVQKCVISISIFILFISLVLATCIIVLSEAVLGNYLGGAKDLVKIVALIVPFWCTSQVFLNVFRAFQEMKRYSVLVLFQTYGELGLIAYLVLFGHSIFGVLLAVLVVRVTLFIVAGYFVIKRVGLKKPDFTRLKEYLSFGLSMVTQDLSVWTVGASDRFIIGALLGATFVGFYNPGYVLGTFIVFLIAPLSFVLPAVLAKYFEEERIKELQNILRYSLKYFLMLAIPAIFGLAVLSKQLLIILSTEEIAINGCFVVPFAAIAMLFYGVYTVFLQILLLEKKMRILGHIWIISAALNLALNVILIPIIGILGAAMSTLVTYVLATLLTMYYSFNYFRFHIEWGAIGKSIAASAITAFIVYYFNPCSFAELLVAIGIGIFVYGIIVIATRCFNRDETNFLKDMAKSILH